MARFTQRRIATVLMVKMWELHQLCGPLGDKFAFRKRYFPFKLGLRDSSLPIVWLSDNWQGRMIDPFCGRTNNEMGIGMHKYLLALAASALLPAAGSAAEQPPIVFPGEPVEVADLALGSKAGNPTFELPSNARLLTPFGERPVFSPDGTKIAFIGESYGDAFEYDLATGEVRNLTAHAAHKGFLRIHYLSDGSFLLLGPRVPAATRAETRFTAIEMFWMDGAAKSPPVALGVTVWEGLAVSHQGNKVAWAESVPIATTFTDVERTPVKVATVEVDGNTARLADVEEVINIPASECYFEGQDFLPDDSGLIMPCYGLPMSMRPESQTYQTKVVSLDFATGDLTTYPTPPELYGEVEGMFPDGKHTLVECSIDNHDGMDICVLELKEDNPRYTRLTRIMDYGRWKWGNPVVSPDGTQIAMQIGSADVIDAGVGQGIVLVELETMDGE